MRTSGILTVLASLLLSPTLRAEPVGPATSKAKGAPPPAAAPNAAKPADPVAAAPKPTKPAVVAPAKNEPSKALGIDGKGCTLSGTAVPALDLQLTDAEGRPLARFGGVAVPLTLSDFPDKADGKVRVVTGGGERLRVDGFVPVRSMPIYLNQDVPVIAGHVKVLKGTAIEYVGLSGNQVRIAVKTKDSLAETFNTTVSCDALSIESQQKLDKWSPPGHARGYIMKQPVLPLFNKPGADAKPVTSIHLSPDARGLFFFGDRREGDFIHVLYHHDVVVDGWIAAKDLEILPRGELVDQSVSKYVAPSDKRLQMRAEGQLHKAPSDLSLYGKADHKLPPIGMVARNAELYVLDVVVGWASVLPKQLDVVPLGERHFWVRAKELGL